MTTSAISTAHAPAVSLRWRRVQTGLRLVALAFVILWQRVRTYSEPLERDIAGYAIIAHEMLNGRALYADLWERKPPLLFGTLALAEIVAGYGPREVFVINLAAAWVTLVAMYFAGRACGAGAAGGLMAAALWTLLCGDLRLVANQPNAEALVNACVTLAFALLVNWPRRRPVLAALRGALFSAATLYKHHVIVICIALAAAYCLRWPRRPDDQAPDQVSARVKAMLIAGGVVAVSWLSVFGYFAAMHRLSPLIDLLFRENVRYGGGLVHNLMQGLQPVYLTPSVLIWALGPIALVALWVIDATRHHRAGDLLRREWLLWLAWVVSTWVTVVLPGHFFGHYYQLWIPVFCVAGGWAAGLLFHAQPRSMRLFSGSVIALVLAILSYRELRPFVQLTPAQWSIAKYYRLEDFVADDQFGRELAALLQPSEQFYELGEENTIYFSARRSPPTGLIYLDAFAPGPVAAGNERRLLSDLQQAKPDVIVISLRWLDVFRSNTALLAWLKEQYVPATAPSLSAFGQYRLLVRRGTAFQRRLQAAFPS